MRRLSLDAIVTIATQLAEHHAATHTSRIVYLCAHVLPAMDMDKAPYHAPLEEWDAYLDSYGIRPLEKRWVIKGFLDYQFRDLPARYESEHLEHLTWSLKRVGTRIAHAETDYQSDYHPGEKAPADAPDINADTHEKPQ